MHRWIQTAIHNSKEFCQIHFLSFELQIQEHKHLISTNPPETRRNKVFSWEAWGWKTGRLNHPLPFPQDFQKLLSPLPSHYSLFCSLDTPPHSPFTYQNKDLSIFRLIIQTGNKKDQGSLDTHGSCRHVIRNYLCRSTAAQQSQPEPAPGGMWPTAVLWPQLNTLVSKPDRLSWQNPELSLRALTHFHHWKAVHKEI